MELSRKFFMTVFNDDFIFGQDPKVALQEAKLTEAEQHLAMRVLESDLYSQRNLEACFELAEQLKDVYRWQSNSEGAWVFSAKILFLLRDQQRHLSWFKQHLRPARKRRRATLIYFTPHDILFTATHDNSVLLPGGQIEGSELAIAGAARELHEKTGLAAQHLEFLFEHKSEHYLHSVFLVHCATGVEKAQGEAVKVLYLPPSYVLEGDGARNITMSSREILQRYLHGEGRGQPELLREY